MGGLYGSYLSRANDVTMVDINAEVVDKINREGFEVRDMRVEYRIAARLDDLLTPTVYSIEGGYIVSLAVNGQPSAIIEFLQ